MTHTHETDHLDGFLSIGRQDAEGRKRILDPLRQAAWFSGSQAQAVKVSSH